MQITADMWAGLAVAAAVFILAEACLYLARRKAARAAQHILLNAKREVADIAQLPLHTPSPVIQVTRSGDIVFANPAALEAFEDLTRKGGHHPVLAGLDIYFGKDARPFPGATREIRYGNAIYQQTIARGKIRDADVLIVYCHEITALKLYGLELERARAQAEDAQKAAEKANQARGDFLANMSHELRTPMNGIIGLSDILRESPMPPKEKEMIQALGSSARSLLTLLNDILDFSKIEAGELTIEDIPYDMRALIRQIAQLQEPVARRKGLRLTAEIAPNLPARLVGDPSRLQQILNNLIGNALKFTHEGGITVTVGGEETGTGAFITRIAVADTGIGIPASKHDRIFAKFQQADSSTARKYGGTGLGLAITKDLTEMMGGRIELQSAEGQGTVFTVVIPARIAAAAAVTDGGTDGSGDGRRTGGPVILAPVPSRLHGRILIVDDHPVNLLYMRRALSAMGYTDFDEAGDGAAALDAYRDKKHALILLDCQMPDMDGFEVARRIRAAQGHGERPVIIAVTADAMKGSSEKCLAAGMDGYISKPIDRDKLHQMVGRFIRPDSPPRQPAAPADAPDAPPGTEAADLHMDWAHLSGFTGNDRKVAGEVLGIFTDMLDRDVAELKRVFNMGDPAGWDRTVHKIYGAAANIGAVRLAGLCDQGQNLGAREITARLEELHNSILAETRCLHDIIENGPAPEGKAASLH